VFVFSSEKFICIGMKSIFQLKEVMVEVSKQLRKLK